MKLNARVIALGQPVAGDDGVGVAVFDALRRVPAKGVELVQARDATELVDRICDVSRVVLLDAIVDAGKPGQIITASLKGVSLEARSRLSSHGLSVRQAVELARSLYPDRVCDDIRVVAITIDPPRRYQEGLSGAVERAIPCAVRAVLATATAPGPEAPGTVPSAALVEPHSTISASGVGRGTPKA